MQLSIIMPVLNDAKEANATVLSIAQTTPVDVQVIAVDDASDKPLILDDETAKVIHLEKRIGAGTARHIGVSYAKSKYIFLCDAHMRFEQGWYEAAMDRLAAYPSTAVWCGSWRWTPSAINVTKMIVADQRRPRGTRLSSRQRTMGVEGVSECVRSRVEGSIGLIKCRVTVANRNGNSPLSQAHE